MDLLKYVLKSMDGSSRPEVLKRELPNLIHTRVRQDTSIVLQAPSSERIKNFDCNNNMLIGSHYLMRASIFDVSKEKGDRYRIVGTWKKTLGIYDRADPETFVKWNSKNKLFTVSGLSNFLYIMDTENLKEIDTVCITGAKRIYQHEPQPGNNHYLAVAADIPKVGIVDLRTGNLSLSSGEHDSAVKSIAWSPSNKHALASCTNSAIFIWDIRMTKEAFPMPMPPVKVPTYKTPPVGASYVVPEVQYVPGSNFLVCITPDQVLHRWNILSHERKSFTNLDLPPHHSRYSFSSVPYSNPPLIFMPHSKFINVINISNMDVINQLVGHIYSVKCTLYNEIKNELYSAGLGDNVVWRAAPMDG